MATTASRREQPQKVIFSPGAKRIATLMVSAVIGVPIASSIAKASRESNLAVQLDRPRDQVRADILAHKIDPTQVVVYTAPSSGLAYDQATHVVGPNQDPTEVSSIMTDQNHNDPLIPEGTASYLPANDVPTELLQ